MANATMKSGSDDCMMIIHHQGMDSNSANSVTHSAPWLSVSQPVRGEALIGPMSLFSDCILEIYSQMRVGTTAANNTRPTLDESKFHTDCKWSGRAVSWQLYTTLDTKVRNYKGRVFDN